MNPYFTAFWAMMIVMALIALALFVWALYITNKVDKEQKIIKDFTEEQFHNPWKQ